MSIFEYNGLSLTTIFDLLDHCPNALSTRIIREKQWNVILYAFAALRSLSNYLKLTEKSDLYFNGTNISKLAQTDARADSIVKK